MKNPKKLIKVLDTMFYSWGGDTPEEIIWSANELLDWLEIEFNLKILIRFEIDEGYCSNYEDVINVLKLLKK